MQTTSVTTEDNSEEALDDAPMPDNQRGDNQDTDAGNGSFVPLDRNPLDTELEKTKMDYLKALSVYQKVQAIAWQDAFNILTFLNRGPDKDPEVDKIEKKVYELYQASMDRWRHTETTLREMKRFRIST